jgi:hypothetical protein
VSFHTSNFTVVEGIGWIAQFTGRDDYRQLLHDAVTAPGGGFNEAAALLAVHHPHADQSPPAAVTDLTAQPMGGGVRLSWTAPGGDGQAGQAAWYQVKHSTARIVERVEGWPDRSPPLPATPEEWEARAAAFHAGQRAFWAAGNLADAPSPQPAGAIETMRVEDLPPGRHYFAVKSWDRAQNLSALSNVAEVVVPDK